MPTQQQTFAARRTTARGSWGLRRSDLARAAGLSGVQITRLEQGLRLPRADMLRRLTDALGMRVDELI